jgi:hypothetical protein
MADLYEKVNGLTLKINSLDVRFAAFFTAGLLFWGVTQTLIFRKLDQIDGSIAQVNENSTAIEVLEYRQDRQDGFNAAVTEEIKEQKAEIDYKFQQLSGQLRSSPTPPTSRTSSGPHN